MKNYFVFRLLKAGQKDKDGKDTMSQERLDKLSDMLMAGKDIHSEEIEKAIAEIRKSNPEEADRLEETLCRCTGKCKTKKA